MGSKVELCESERKVEYSYVVYDIDLDVRSIRDVCIG